MKALEGKIEGEGSLQQYDALLIEVLNRGGRVTREQWQSLGREMGYDPRGLGVFFKGRQPSVRWTDEGFVALTANGRKAAEQAMLRKAIAQRKKGLSRLRPLRQWPERPLSEYVIEDRR